MKSAARIAVLLSIGIYASACDHFDHGSDKTGTPLTAEKAFAAGGKIDLQLESGNYEVHPSTGNRVRIATDEHIGDASVEVTVDGTNASIKTTSTPNRFHATIEVPATSDLVVHLTAGNFELEGISGNKDITSNAGNIKVSVGNPDDYATVDASLKAGDIDASAFGGSKSGVMPHFTWSGPGKRTLRADLGAGNLVLRR
jgi:hypothetical protein